MYGIVGVNVSKHHVYVVVCTRACMRMCVCQRGHVWEWLKIAYVYDEPGKYLVASYTSEHGCLHGVQPA